MGHRRLRQLSLLAKFPRGEAGKPSDSPRTRLTRKTLPVAGRERPAATYFLAGPCRPPQGLQRSPSLEPKHVPPLHRPGGAGRPCTRRSRLRRPASQQGCGAPPRGAEAAAARTPRAHPSRRRGAELALASGTAAAQPARLIQACSWAAGSPRHGGPAPQWVERERSPGGISENKTLLVPGECRRAGRRRRGGSGAAPAKFAAG